MKSLLIIFSILSISVAAAEINWEKLNGGDRQEIDKVYQLQIVAATNCTLTVGLVRQFIKVIPDYVAFAGGFWRTNGPQSFTIRGQKYDRYQITMHMDVWFDTTLTNVVKTGEPRYFLSEYVGVVLRPDGGAKLVNNPKSERKFSQKEWRKIWNEAGDFSVLGLKILTNSPVANFRQYWERSSKGI